MTKTHWVLMTQRKGVQNVVEVKMSVMSYQHLTLLVLIDAMNIWKCGPAMVCHLSLLYHDNTDSFHRGEDSKCR